MDIQRLLFQICLFFGFLYLAIAGILTEDRTTLINKVSDKPEVVIYDSITFRSKERMEVYRAAKNLDKFYPMYANVSDLLVYLLATIGFTGIGVLIRLLRKNDRTWQSQIFMSFALGVVVWTIVIFGPDKFFGQSKVNNTAAFIAGIFAGIFTDKFMAWLEGNFGLVFPKKPISKKQKLGSKSTSDTKKQ